MKKSLYITEEITWYKNEEKGWCAKDPGNKEGFVKMTSIALISKCPFTGLYTMSLLEFGGPIISDENIDTLKKKFMEAFHLGLAVNSLRFFKAA